MKQFEEKETSLHAGLGSFIAWLQHEIAVDNRRLTNAAICLRLVMSSSTYNKIKKGGC